MNGFSFGVLFNSAAKALIALLLIIALGAAYYFLRPYLTIERAGLGFLALLVLVALHDVFQKEHTIKRNFPVIGWGRFILESIGPELRQYWFAQDDDEGPFTRHERGEVYALSKLENANQAFGTTHNLEEGRRMIIEHASFPLKKAGKSSSAWNPEAKIPCAKVMGGWRKRQKAFRPESIVITSAMSFGALGGAATEALNKGAMLAGCLHNTGEGGVSRHHKHGAKLIWQIGTGYFGCRNADGTFSLAKLLETLRENPNIAAIEIKLSQGAKAGKGGILPGAKVTKEIAEARGVPVGQDCISPEGHSAFATVQELIDFVEMLAEASGLPVGIKSAVGEHGFWRELAQQMAKQQRGPDFITIDGGEGGTGAAPLVFMDHVAHPFKDAFTRVYAEFARNGVERNVVWIGAGKLGITANAVFALSMGCDMIAVGREALFSIGCIQARVCHTNRCPAGVTTQSRWLQRGLDPALKSVRNANFLIGFRANLLSIAHACGKCHPSLITPRQIIFRDESQGSRTAEEVYGYQAGWGVPKPGDAAEIKRLMDSIQTWAYQPAIAA